MLARERWRVVRALGDGCVTPNLAINARAEDRALKIKNRFVRWFRSVLTAVV